MDHFPLRWTDVFAGPAPGPRWSGGHTNNSLEATITLAQGLHVEFVEGREYASAGLVTRLPVVGDFDARVHFSVTQPAQGTTFELAAISVDPPAEPAFDQSTANSFTRSRAYDVHGAPPYVSSEYDEDNGWRIGWNRGPSISKPTAAGTLIADNHYNRYGRSLAPVAARPITGWLRLVRLGQHWTSYRLDSEAHWQETGQIRHMNLPDAVYLRVAAKHWVKGRAGAATAPANRVSFDLMELRSEAPTELPLAAPPARNTVLPEVALVRELRGCRRCPAFTAENIYGPFPQIDAGGSKVRDVGPPEPAALYGCRKAPIMLVGINPNLPGHFIFPRSFDAEDRFGGSHRLVPFFADDAAYAAHYRFGPTPAYEIADAASLEHLLQSDGRGNIIAPLAGKVVPPPAGPALNEDEMTGSFRKTAAREARLELHFDDGTTAVHAISWRSGENLALVRRRFKAGEVVAGLIDHSAIGRALATRLQTEEEPFYANAGALLTQIGEQLPGAKLLLGEDMSLHDAVACASPRWNDAEMPLQVIRDECVGDRRWLHRQIEQSAPVVIVIAGRTALELFAAPEAGRLTPPLSALPRQPGGRDGLYRWATLNPLTWTYRAGAGLRRVRVIVAPHFSYGDNFDPHAYFEAEEWPGFQAAHPLAVAWLQREKRLRRVFESDDWLVLLKKDDPAWAAVKQLDAVAAGVLAANWSDPFVLLGSAVAAELTSQHIAVGDDGRLQRSAGPCSFCVNPLWQLPGGCRYDALAS